MMVWRNSRDSPGLQLLERRRWKQTIKTEEEVPLLLLIYEIRQFSNSEDFARFVGKFLRLSKEKLMRRLYLCKRNQVIFNLLRIILKFTLPLDFFAISRTWSLRFPFLMEWFIFKINFSRKTVKMILCHLITFKEKL